MPQVAFITTPSPTRQSAGSEQPWTPEPTSTRRPTPRSLVTVAPTATPTTPAELATPQPPPCADANICIVSPSQGARVEGRVDVIGTANAPNFQFYKVELGLGERPANWSSISDIHRTPVLNGLLDVWDTTSLPAGSYSLRLVVVDNTGNFRPPYVVLVTVVH